jgi:hypothetical protein
MMQVNLCKPLIMKVCRCGEMADATDLKLRFPLMLLKHKRQRAAGLENADVVQQTLIHVNEIDAEQPIEAEIVTTVEAPQCD